MLVDIEMTWKKVVPLLVIGSSIVLLFLAGLELLRRIDTSFEEEQRSTIEWITEKTQIQISSDAELLEYYDGIEYGKLLKYRMDTIAMNSIITNYGLSRIHSDEAGTLLIVDIEENWEVGRMKKENVFYYLQDCKSGVLWTLLAEKDQGILWFEVIHADYSGDVPECEKE